MKTYLEAVREALWESLEADPAVFLLGEDIGVYGGAFKVTQGFVEHFGASRIIDTPIAEAGIIDRPAPLQPSNVMLKDPETGKPTRVRFEEREGEKVRVAVKSGVVIK